MEGLTCIMPTMVKRRRLLPASLRTFARQTYGDARLLIALDDDGGTAHMTHLIDKIGADLGIRARIDIITVNTRNLGSKRNALCDAAKTKWIAFWDDDDWSAPSRLEATIAAIEVIEDARLADPPPIPWTLPALIGSRTMLIHEILDLRRRTFVYRWHGEAPYFVGGLLCFERRLWMRKPFASEGESAQVGDESWWQLGIADSEVYRHELSTDPTLYCAFIHRLNTANTQAPTGDRSWRRVPTHGDHDPEGDPVLAQVMGPELAIWEDAHGRVMIDPLVFGSVGGHMVEGS